MPGLEEAIKLSHLFRAPAHMLFTRLAQTAITDLVHQIDLLNERILRSSCLQSRVEYKTGQLATVLAALRSQNGEVNGQLRGQ